ncbi:Hsp20/alpha crystallin family protein [Patescibacteria group bacterium]|nr:Hsp20/alpha crystallin family protein [Patescibacteria group bacterium]
MKNLNSPPFLNKNEEVLLFNSGLFKENLRSGWKPGHFYLTNRRLLFSQPPGISFQTLLDDITNLTIERKAVILRSKNILVVTYGRTEREKVLKAWIAVNNIENWKKRIYERSLLMLNEETIGKIIKELDFTSRRIPIYLWQRGHARIEELAKLIAAPNHMDVLLKIKEHINPIAERIIGCSILSFEKSRFDPETGKKILFSWWILGQKEKEEEKEILSDIFDEGIYLNIIVELPGVRKTEDILFKLEPEKMTISTSSANKKYYKEINLPAEVNTKDFSKSLNNNVLEIKLKKTKVATLKDN